MTDDRDDFEQELSERLHQATPDPPPAISRAEGARRYARRSRRTKGLLAVGAAAAVVAAIVVVPTVLTSGSGNGQVATGPTATAPTAVLPSPKLAHPFTCPAPGQPATPVSPPANGVVPSGAVLARICPAASQFAGRSWTAPQQALVSNLGQLVKSVNALPTRPTLLNCPLIVEPFNYTLTFQYADGHAVSVRAMTQGCDLVTTGTVQRAGASRLLRDYLNLLWKQRGQYVERRTASAAPSCTSQRVNGLNTTTAVVVDHRQLGLAGAVVCQSGLPGVGPTQGKLTQREIGLVERDLTLHATRTQPGCWSSYPPPARETTLIVGVDRWGDRVTLAVGFCAGVQIEDRSGSWYWHPTPATQRMLTYALKLPGHPLLTPPGHVFGRLFTVGGPVGTPNRPLPGQISLSGPHSVTISVGKSGEFKASVPPGRYQVIGHSPWYQSGKASCQPAHPYVVVRAGQQAKVDVYCQEN